MCGGGGVGVSVRPANGEGRGFMVSYLSVQLHVGVLGLVDEDRVRHAVLTYPRVDPLYPEPAEVPLLILREQKKENAGRLRGGNPLPPD